MTRKEVQEALNLKKTRVAVVPLKGNIGIVTLRNPAKAALLKAASKVTEISIGETSVYHGNVQRFYFGGAEKIILP